MIVATAGHIDHGKTSLVRALTGIDADRLPEEKRRGMTIDLGFAYSALPDGRSVLGFVDVPGHERFVRNMLAGVGGIDLALLVIAADDGVMPQTREHLAILDLLGTSRGVVALTKVDRVGADRVREVTEEIDDLLDETVLAGAPVFPLSSVSGDGIPALRAYLEKIAVNLASRATRGYFRLSVDRCFSMRGAGLIVTGTAFAGSVKVGDRLMLAPIGLPVRVRGIHAQNRETHAATAGQRCALNLAGNGLSKEIVSRGDWIVAEEILAPTRRLDTQIRLLAEGNPLRVRDRMPIHLHLGAGDVTGRIALIEESPLLPGDSGLVQVVLDQPIPALAGDRFVLRDQSARMTIGGGRVVDPFPPERGRTRPERRMMLAAIETDDAAEALSGALALAPDGVNLASFAKARNLTGAEQGLLWRKVQMVRLGHDAQALGLAEARWHDNRTAILEALADWHEKHPEMAGAEPDRLRRSLPTRIAPPVFAAVTGDLAAKGQIKRESGVIRLPNHRIQISGDDAALWAKVEPLLESGGIRPPRVREIAEQLKLDHTKIEKLLYRMSRLGVVHSVADNRYFPPRALADLARIAENVAAEGQDGSFTAAVYKDRTGIGRNVTIQLLEFFDQRGFTKRDGEVRRILKPASDLFPA